MTIKPCRPVTMAAALGAALICLTGTPHQVLAFDAQKVRQEGLVRSDLSTWTQWEDSFPENGTLSVDGASSLSVMGCSYYATFFMLCRMQLRDPLTDTAWQLAQQCRDLGLAREGTGYFDPRSIPELTDGRVSYVEEGTGSSYYDGQAAVASCRDWDDVNTLVHRLCEDRGWFLVACATGNVTDRNGEEYHSDGHYFFIDEAYGDDWSIFDSGFPGTRWSDNWGEHGDPVVKIYAYELFSEYGNQVRPADLPSLCAMSEESPESGPEQTLLFTPSVFQ